MTDTSAHEAHQAQLELEALGFFDTSDVCMLPDCGCDGDPHPTGTPGYQPEPTAAQIFCDHWAGCDWCQEGLPCAEGDPLWEAMNQEVRDDS